jgi:hypothetical protein
VNLRNDTKNIETKNFAEQQLKFYKTMGVAMLTYASENWTINRSDKSAEMKFLRSVAGSKTKYRQTFRIKSIQFN